MWANRRSKLTTFVRVLGWRFVVSIMQPHLWKAMGMLSTTSRMNKICFIVDYALNKFPPSPYYPIALFGPIMVRC